MGTNLYLQNVSTERVPDEEPLLSNPTIPEAEAQRGKWLVEVIHFMTQSQFWLLQAWPSLSLTTFLSFWFDQVLPLGILFFLEHTSFIFLAPWLAYMPGPPLECLLLYSFQRWFILQASFPPRSLPWLPWHKWSSLSLAAVLEYLLYAKNCAWQFTFMHYLYVTHVIHVKYVYIYYLIFTRGLLNVGYCYPQFSEEGMKSPST